MEWSTTLLPLLIWTLVHVRLSTPLVQDSELFPYDEAAGNSRFSFGDDDFIEVRLSLPFHFFNRTYSSVFISGNGQISFGEGVRTYTPNCSPSSVPMIMAFWADADNRVDPRSARLLYRETTNRALLQKASKDVFLAFPQLQGITLSWMLIVTWKDIPFYGATGSCSGLTKRNTYQLILTTDGLHSFALLYYNGINWSTGVSSGGTCEGKGGQPAKAGFDYGDGKMWYTIPGSCTSSILKVGETTNINQPGKWVFRIDSNLDAATCEKFDESRQLLRLQPPIVSAMGNVPVLVHGPCLEKNVKVTCVFHDVSRPTPVETEGVVLGGKLVTVCSVPYLYSLGRIRVDLLVSYPNQIPTLYKGFLYAIQEADMSTSPKVYVNKTQDGLLHLTATWNPHSLEMEDIEKLEGSRSRKLNSGNFVDAVDVSVVEYNGKSWVDYEVISEAVPNNGKLEAPLKEALVKRLASESKAPPRAFVVKGKRVLRSGAVVEKQQASSVLDGTEILGVDIPHFVLFEGSREEGTSSGADVPHYSVDSETASRRDTGRDFDELCRKWHESEPPPPSDHLPCPRTEEQALVDTRFTLDKNENLQNFNPGAFRSFIQSTPSPSGAGSQCTYDERGRLLVGPPSGGRLHRRSPNSQMDHWGHYWDDVIPFMYCCKWSISNKRNCRKYLYSKRPSDDGSRYAPPRPTRATGDPHITTFDGLTYTFNPIGEFWMVKYNSSKTSFKMQARMEQYISVEGVSSNASVFTAAVMQQQVNGKEVKVQVAYSSQKIFVLVDDEPLELGDQSITTSDNSTSKMPSEFTLFHGGATVFLKSEEEVVVSFSSGFSFTFTTAGLNEVALNILGSASPVLMNKTEGLMGNFDENIENDMVTPNGTLLPINSSMEAIHFRFGMNWMVPENDSIFLYAPGKSYRDYYKPHFRPTFLTPDAIQKVPGGVIDFCGGLTDCIFDYVATGSNSIANATKSAHTAFEEVVQVVIHEVKQCQTPPEPRNGYFTTSHHMRGGIIRVHCEKGFVPHFMGGLPDLNFTCSEVVFAENDKVELRWLGQHSRLEIPTMVECLSEEEMSRQQSMSLNALSIVLTVGGVIGCFIILTVVAYIVFVRRGG